MDINNLQAFIEVAEKRSFSRSAESLKLTQPAVSKRIAALETELASRLFDRVGRRVHLTEAGKVLLPSALKISSEVSRIESEISCLGKEVGGKLSIGVAEHINLERLAPLLKSYKRNFSSVEIDLQFSKTSDSLAATESGQLDMSLCAVSDIAVVNDANSRLVSVEVWKEPLKVMAEKSHSLVRSGPVTVQELAKYPGILPQEYSAIRKSINQLMITNSVEANVAMEATDFPTAKSMASIGLGWAFLPQTTEDDLLSVVSVEGIDFTYSVALIRNPDRSMSRAAQAFVDTLPAWVI